jgi:hypothetical protein
MKPTDLPDSLSFALHAEQAIYGGVVERVAQIALVLLGVAFPAHVFGWLPSQWPLERLPQWWGESARHVAAIAPPSGWPELVLVRADLLNLAGIALLCSAPSLGLIGLVPRYWRRGERAYALICLALLALLAVAAVGMPQRGR